jgi:hypothetical protein
MAITRTIIHPTMLLILLLTNLPIILIMSLTPWKFENHRIAQNIA